MSKTAKKCIQILKGTFIFGKMSVRKGQVIDQDHPKYESILAMLPGGDHIAKDLDSVTEKTKILLTTRDSLVDLSDDKKDGDQVDPNEVLAQLRNQATAEILSGRTPKSSRVEKAEEIQSAAAQLGAGTDRGPKVVDVEVGAEDELIPLPPVEASTAKRGRKSKAELAAAEAAKEAASAEAEDKS